MQACRRPAKTFAFKIHTLLWHAKLIAAAFGLPAKTHLLLFASIVHHISLISGSVAYHIANQHYLSHSTACLEENAKAVVCWPIQIRCIICRFMIRHLRPGKMCSDRTWATYQPEQSGCWVAWLSPEELSFQAEPNSSAAVHICLCRGQTHWRCIKAIPDVCIICCFQSRLLAHLFNLSKWQMRMQKAHTLKLHQSNLSCLHYLLRSVWPLSTGGPYACQQLASATCKRQTHLSWIEANGLSLRSQHRCTVSTVG